MRSPEIAKNEFVIILLNIEQKVLEKAASPICIRRLKRRVNIDVKV